MNILDKADAVGTLRGFLAGHGLRVEIVSDYRRISELSAIAGKDYLTPLSSPNHNDFTQENCICLCAWSGETPVIFGVARLEDIGGEPIAEYWERSLARAYPSSGNRRIRDVAPEITDRVSGRLVYFGDLYVMKGWRGGRVALRAFTAIGHLLVSLKWDPDWTYCFLRASSLGRAANFYYNFNLFVPKPFEWVGDVAHPRSNSEAAAFLGRPYLSRVLGQTLDDVLGSLERAKASMHSEE